MSILQMLIISLIQGITEWLPISSSAHVLLAAQYYGFDGRDEVLINAMAHLGTLAAVLLYFWRDILRAIAGGFELVGSPFRRAQLSPSAHLAACIIAATPIAVGVGVIHETLLSEGDVAFLRNGYVIAASTIGFGALLWLADRQAEHRTARDLTLFGAAAIGATQAIAAIIPGTSRSGITMTAGRFMGLTRTEAARFAMLIGAPLLAAVGFYALYQLYAEPVDTDTMTVTLSDGLTIAGLSFASGFLSIAALMALLKRMSFLPFVLYRFGLGALLLLGSPLALGWFSAAF